MAPAAIISEVFYVIIGIIFILVGVKALKDPNAQKKGTTVAFWFILAFTFICGYWLPKWLTGLAIVAMAVITGIKGVVQSASDVPDPKVVRERADAIGYKIFIPSLVLALGAVLLTTLGAKIPAMNWMNGNNSICVSAVFGMIAVLALTKAAPKYAVTDGTRLMDNVGPTGILPQLLTALGSLFTAAGVGQVIAGGVAKVVPEGNKLIACAIYCIAMAVFTIIMGNGFAAFSVITVGIGIPFLIAQGANPELSVHSASQPVTAELSAHRWLQTSTSCLLLFLKSKTNMLSSRARYRLQFACFAYTSF